MHSVRNSIIAIGAAGVVTGAAACGSSQQTASQKFNQQMVSLGIPRASFSAHEASAKCSTLGGLINQAKSTGMPDHTLFSLIADGAKSNSEHIPVSGPQSLHVAADFIRDFCPKYSYIIPSGD